MKVTVNIEYTKGTSASMGRIKITNVNGETIYEEFDGKASAEVRRFVALLLGNDADIVLKSLRR